MGDKPLIIQSDLSILLDVHAPNAHQARNDLIAFAELIKSPEHVHTYVVTPLSLWNASSAGVDTDEVLRRLEKYSRFEIPQTVLFHISEISQRFGAITLESYQDNKEYYFITFHHERIKKEVLSRPWFASMLTPFNNGFLIKIFSRGEFKLQLIKLGYPVDDRIPIVVSKKISASFKEVSSSGVPFVLRDYQKNAADALLGDYSPGTGYGTIVLPCGSGKTVVGMEIITRLQTKTLILTTNISAVHQWISELYDKLNIPMNSVAEYTGMKKELKDITVATYQVLTYRKDKESEFIHMNVIKEEDWGLIIFDEVHMLPAPVFKITAEMQSAYRLGLTATLIREDHREDEVFSLVGPKRFDVPWSELERSGWIAEAECVEIRVHLPTDKEIAYAIASKRDKYRIASENERKIEIVKELIENHQQDFILVIGQYLTQLKSIAKELGAPLITGSTPENRRDQLYQDFRDGKQRILVVSKVANFAIDLPDASVAIQVSGSFGSRQEEAQRLGRILRPKKQNSHFYSIVTRFSSEEEFAAHRQKFLSEQGYHYRMEVYS
ncbi:MAG: DEAD/DEAH box helicase [Spirochaetia bacterium]|nr:DEAD/DEAH box helicase [Spirochaetia bacterium]